ncbi:MAG: glycoside hydrolase family 95 protein [Lachnospiraceae bacterium]|nr:glycoside hydrolase family 95 protein [Lachnospiraceae bacterium]
MRTIWFNKPAGIWEEALPLGNGKLGAMIYGGTVRDQIALNEETMWSGGYSDRNNPDAKEALPKVQKLILEGKISEAEDLMQLAFAGCPNDMRVYQTMGDLMIDQKDPGEVLQYRRELDLSTAVCTTSYRTADTSYEKEYFISAPANLLIIHMKASGEKKLNFQVKMERWHFFGGTMRTEDNGVALWGQLPDDGVSFYSKVTGTAKGGKLYAMGRSLVAEDAEEVTLYYCAATSFWGEEPEAYVNKKLAVGMAKAYEALKEEHIKDYQSYFHRVNLELYNNEELKTFSTNAAKHANVSDIPTGELLASVKNGEIPSSLVETYFDFGRYLLISSSRPGTLPANLQGIWCKDFTPPWGSKYTININAQMNYWPAETCNLSECHTTLLDHIKRMVEHGRATAEKMYGCRGFVAHHNTDIWGDTAPQDLWIPGTYWVMGAAWLCTHQWTHYVYTQDKEFLQEAFPIMREAALFFLDFMIEHEGYLVTCPSVSPENTFILPSGERGCNSAGVTMDNQILRDLFTQCIEAAKILGVDDELNEKIKYQLSRLRPTQIASNGTLMEWDKEYEEAEPGHRHISHLFGLYPSNQITLEETPELTAAAEKTLERRLSMGGGHTGWSCAWIINLYARLQKGDKVYDTLKKLFSNSTLSNLFDNHPPFQIDGNFGATAAIVEMLIQARNGKVFLLPALPKQWPNGRIEGVRLPGNAEAALAWNDGKVTEFVVTTSNREWYAEVFENGEAYPLKIVYKN